MTADRPRRDRRPAARPTRAPARRRIERGQRRRPGVHDRRWRSCGSRRSSSRCTSSLRPESETNRLGYVSMPHHLTLANFSDAWKQSDMWHFFLNSVLDHAAGRDHHAGPGLGVSRSS